MGDRLQGRVARTLLFLFCAVILLGFMAVALFAQEIKEKKRHFPKGKEKDIYSIKKGDLPEIRLLQNATNCELCHRSQYQEWESSAHGTSYTNRFFQEGLAHYNEFYQDEYRYRSGLHRKTKFRHGQPLPEEVVIPEKTNCLSCHTPSIDVIRKYSDDQDLKSLLGLMKEGFVPLNNWDEFIDKWVANRMKVFANEITIRQKLNVLRRSQDYLVDGVSCDYCHTITRLPLMEIRNPLVIENTLNAEHRFGLQKFGPYTEGPTSSHVIQYSPVYEKAEFCSSCHQEVNGFGIIAQNTYQEWRKSDYPRKGVTCQSCHMRPSLGLPSIHSANKIIHDHSIKKTYLDTELVTTAVKLDTETKRIENNVVVTVGVSNEGAGHMLPTGLPFRQVVLVVRAKSETGEVFFEDLRYYQRLVGSKKTGEVLPYWMADADLSDNRIAPEERRVEEYTIDVSEQVGKIYVTTQLFYRRAPKEWGDKFEIENRPTLISYSVNEID